MTDFGWALIALKAGRKVARAGWNGKGMWLRLVTAQQYAVGTSKIGEEINNILGDRMLNLLPWIGMKTADDKFVPWLCSQTDMLAEDWEVVV